MSSPFQKNFSAKSPITTSPLAVGGYASGVDGMRYVSPTQPPSSTSKATKAKKPKEEKEEKEDYLKSPEGKEALRKQEISRTQDNIGRKIDEGKLERDQMLFELANKKKFPSVGSIKEARVEKNIIPGIKVEKIETDQKKYLKSFEAGFARDREGTTNIKDYILKKEGKYKPKTIYQNQERTGETLDGKLVGDMSEWANVGDEYEKN